MTITKGLGRFLTAGVIFGAIAGCSANAPSGQTSGWSRTDLKPVSQPVAAGGTFVLYVAAHGGLELIGLDPHSGRTLWQDVASPSVITPGVAPELLVLGDHVFRSDSNSLRVCSSTPGAPLLAATRLYASHTWLLGMSNGLTSDAGMFSSLPPGAAPRLIE
jgi:hypothetical protein